MFISRFRHHLEGSSHHPIETSSSSYGLIIRFQLLSTPPRGDAVTFSFKVTTPLEETFTLLISYHRKRTRCHHRGIDFFLSFPSAKALSITHIFNYRNIILICMYRFLFLKNIFRSVLKQLLLQTTYLITLSNLSTEFASLVHHRIFYIEILLTEPPHTKTLLW